jgi:CBS domain-containing protein
MTTPVLTVGPDAHLKDVAATLVEHRVNAVPVVDDRGRLLGIVSGADLLGLEAASGPQTGSRPATRLVPPQLAREVMSRSVYTLTAGTDAAAAARMLLRHNLKSAPVVDGDQVVGIVGRRDLLRLIARDDHDIRADLERRLKDELAALQRLQVEVADGVVTIDAAARPFARQLLEVLAWTVPGVVEVRTGQPATDGFEPAEGDRQ